MRASSLPATARRLQGGISWGTLLVFVSSLAVLPADTLTWDANTGVAGAQDGAGTWGAASTQWWYGAANQAFNATDTAAFGNSDGAAGTVAVSGTVTAAGLVFNAGSQGDYTLSGGTVTIGAGGISANQNATLSGAVTLGAAQSWTTASGKLLSVGGTVANGANLLTISGAGDTAISGVIGNGAGGLAKTGAGTLTLSGSNSYGGSTTVSGGTLSISSDANLGAVPPTATAGSLVLDGGTLLASESFTLGANRGIAVGRSSGIGYGTLEVAAGKTLAYAGTVADNGVSSTGGLVKAGAGTLVLSGTNTYSGDTTVSSGTLRLGSLRAVPAGTGKGNVTVDGTLDVNGYGIAVNGLSGTGLVTSGAAGAFTFTTGSNNASGSFSGVLADGSGTMALTKVGTGTQTLAGTNTFTGGVTINAGALRLGGAGALNSSGVNSVTFGASAPVGTRLQLNGQSVTVAGLATNATPGSVVVENASAAAAALTVNQAGNSTFAGTLQDGTGGGAFSLIKSGTGTLALSGSNTYTGSTVVSGGTLKLLSAAALPSSGGGDLILSGTLDVNGLSVASNGLGGSGVVTSGAAGAAAFTTGGNNQSGTFSGVIQNGSGTLSLTKVGTGTLTLAGANTYGGATAVKNGVLLLSGGANRLPAGTVLTLGDAAANSSGMLRLDGNNQTLAGLQTAGTGTANRITNGNAAAVTLTLNTAANSTFSGILGGAGANDNNFSLVKTGSGTLTLTGANTYTGTTAVSQGTLSVSSLADGGSLGGGASAVTLGDASSQGVLAYTGNGDTFTRGLTVNAGGGELDTVTAGSSLTVQTGGIAAGGVFTVGGAGATTIASVISGGSGSLVKTGTGTLVLSGANTYGGATAIRNGTLALGGGGDRLPAGTVLTLGDSTANTNGVLKLDGQSQTLAGLLKVGTGTANRVINGTGTAATLTLNIGSGTNSFDGILGGSGTNDNNFNLVKTGTGTLAFTRNHSFTGTATVSAGTLLVTADGQLGAAASTLVLDGGVLASGTNVTLNAARSLLVGPASGSGTGAIDTAAGTTLTFGGVIGNNGAGSGSLVKTGAGTLNLSGANTYSGTTFIKNGAVSLGASGALPAGTILSLGDSGTNTSGTFKLNKYSQTVAGLATAGTGTSNRVVNGNLTTATLTISNADASAFAGILGGSGTNEDNFAVVKSGTGTLTLSGTNTFAGGLTVSSGTLKVTSTTAIPYGVGKGNIQIDGILDLNNVSIGLNGLSGSGTIQSGMAGTPTLTLGYNDQTSTFAGVIQNGVANSVAVTKTGTGTLTLSGANLYTGTTTVSGGVLKIGNDSALPTGAGKSGLALNGGSLDLNGHSITLNGITGTSGVSSGVAGAVALTVGNSDTSSTYSGVIANGSGTVGLTKIGTGTLTLSAASTYTGETLIKNGVVTLGTNSALPSGSVLTLGDAATNDAGTLKLDRRTVTLAGIQTAGTGTSRIIGGNSTAGALTVSNTANYTYAGILGGDGANENNFAFTKTGVGMLTLSSSNSYSGATTVSAGTLRIGVAGALPSTGNLTVNTGTLDINSFDTTVRNLAGTGKVLNNAAGTSAILTVTSQANSTFSGVIANGSGTISLTKIGTGTLTISGTTNTYTGITTITQGALAIITDTSLGATPSMATAGSLVINDGATLSTPSSSITLNANRGIAIGPTSGTGTATFDIAATRTLTYSGIITNNGSGTGALIKANAGTFVLGSTANSYAGGTLVNAGLLVVTATAGTPLGADVAGNNVNVAAGANLSLSSTANKGANQSIIVNSTSGALGGIGISNNTLTQAGLSTIFTDSTGSYGGVLGINTAYSAALDMSAFGNGYWFLGSAVSSTYSASALTAGAGNTYRLGGGGATLTISQANVITGANDVVIGSAATNGGGTVVFSGSQNYSGATIINGGTLQVSADNRLGTGTGPGSIVINGGALAFSAGATLNASRGIMVGPDSGSGSGTLSVSSGTLIYSGTIADNGGGTGSLIKTGAGTLDLSAGNSTYSGDTTLSTGTVIFAGLQNLGTGTSIVFNGGTLRYAAGNSTDITSRAVILTNSGGTVDTGTNSVVFSATGVSSTGTGTFTKTGVGTLTFSATNNYTGATTISAGTLKLGGLNVLPTGGALTVNGTLDVNGYDTTVRNLAGTGTVLNNAVDSGSVLTVTSQAASSFNGVIADNAGSGGTLSLVKTGAGNLTLSGINTYTGTTLISTGTLTIVADSGLGATPSSPTAGSLTINGGATLATGTTVVTLDSNRGIAIGPTSGTGTATVSVASGRILTYNGIITDNGGTGALTKTNTGTLVLGGANTYSGDTTITAGTLKVAADGAIPHGTDKGNLIVTSTLDLNNTSITVNGLSGTGTVTNSLTGAAVLTAGDNDATSSFSGVIQNGSGTVGLTKTGNGTLTLSGVNTYTGTTTIAGGTLSVGADNNLGGGAAALVISSGTLAVSNSFTLGAARNLALGPASGAGAGVIDIAAGKSLTYAGAITDNGSGTGGLTKTNTTGTLVLSGTGTYSGDTTVLGGTLQVTGASALPSGAGKGNLILSGTLDLRNTGAVAVAVNGLSGAGVITNSQTGTVTFSAGGNDQTGTFSGVIQDGNGKLALTKTGTGILTLAGANSYSGDTTVSGGTLQLGNVAAVPSGLGKGNLTVNGALDLNGYGLTANGLAGTGTITNSALTAATLTAGATDQTATFAGSIQDGNGIIALTKTGAGKLTLSGSNSYSGATTIASGTVAVGSASGLSGNSSITIASQGTLDVNGYNVAIDGLAGTGIVTNNGAANVTLSAGASGASSQFDGIIADGSKTIALTKTGTGTLTLTSLNTYSGITTISNGAISVANPGPGGNLGTSTAAIVLGDATHRGTLVYTGSTDLAFTRGFTVNAGGGEMDITASGKTLTIQGANIDTAGAFTVGGAGNAVIQSVISGAGGLVKSNSGSMLLSATNTYAGDTVINAGTLQVGNAAAVPSGSGKGNVAVNGSGVLDVNGLSLTVNGLSGTGTVTSVAPAGALTFTAGANDQTSTFSGVIQNGNASSLTFVKTGTGVLTLAGANTYTGSTLVNAGTLRLGSSAALPAGNSIGVDGTLDLNGNAAAVETLAGSGTIVNSQGSAILSVASGTFGGVMRDDGGVLGLTKVGTGMLTLSGSSSFSGATTISSGTLSMGSTTGLSAHSSLYIDNAGALDVNGYSVVFDGLAGTGAITNNSASAVTLTTGASGGSGTFGGSIQDGTGVIAITKTGAGTITFTTRNTYSGGTRVTAGTLAITADENIGAAPAAPATGSIVLDGGALAVLNTFTLNANRGIAVGPAAGSGSGTLNVAENQTLTYGGVIANQGDGTGTLVKTGDGTLTLTNANTYSGDTLIELGAIQIGNAGAIPSGAGKGNVTVNDTLDLNNIAITVNGLSGAGTVTNTLGGSVLFTAGANDQTSTFAGVIQNGNGQVALAKTGTGTLTLTGNNTYSGTTHVADGTLQVGDGGVTGTLGSGTVTDEAALVFKRSDTITVNNRITGAGTLTQAGSGTVKLTAVNDYAGGTWLDDGTLNFTSSALGGGAVTFNGGILQWESGNTRDVSAQFAAVAAGKTARLDSLDNGITLASAITGQGGLEKLGTGTITLAAANTYSGATTVSDGRLIVGATGALGSGDIVNHAVLEFQHADTYTVAAPVSGSGTLIQSGAGTLALTRANSYTGGTLLNAGTVSFANGALGAGGNIGFNGGTLQWASGNTQDVSARFAPVAAGQTALLDTNGNSVTLAAAVTGQGGLTKLGAGTLTLTADNTYTGATLVSSGTMVVSGAGTLNRSSGVTVANGSTLAYNGNELLTAPLTITNGTITGTGMIQNLAVIIGTSATMAPGNCAGTQTYSTVTWAAGGRYLWEVNTVTTGSGFQESGLRGAETGFDFADITGALTITATETDRFVVDITGLKAGTNELGAVTNWTTDLQRSFVIATASEGVVGFDARKFWLKVDNFTANNDLAVAGVWSIEQQGNNIVLTYNAVPEPALVALLGLGAVGLLRRRRE